MALFWPMLETNEMAWRILTLDNAPYICPRSAVIRSWTPLHASYGPLWVINDCHWEYQHFSQLYLSCRGFILRLQLLCAPAAITPRPGLTVSEILFLGSCRDTFAIESLGPKYKDPIAIAFSKRGWVHSRKTNVARCRIGKVGMKRTKNIWRHSSRKTDVMDAAFTAAVTLED